MFISAVPLTGVTNVCSRYLQTLIVFISSSRHECGLASRTRRADASDRSFPGGSDAASLRHTVLAESLHSCLLKLTGQHWFHLINLLVFYKDPENSDFFVAGFCSCKARIHAFHGNKSKEVPRGEPECICIHED